MGRWKGTIGFGVPKEVEPGIYEERITERQYGGDYIRRRVQLGSNEGSNPQFTMSEEISITADDYAKRCIGYMRYAVLFGQKWEVTAAVFQPPRINLTLGGLWHE